MTVLYLDNNATTALSPAAWEAMRPYLLGTPGNPASAHGAGRQTRRALEDARETVAQLLGAHPDEVVFTSGATEANNLALFGLAGSPPGTLLSSPLEHPSVLEPLRQLSKIGYLLEFLPVHPLGAVILDDLGDRLRPDTRLVALMLANHETGAIQPVQELSRQLPPGIALHCDAVQMVGKRRVHFHELGATTLSLSAHKFHGPPGAGALLVRRGTALRPQLFGGHQQQGLRPGTEAVAQAVGLATALGEGVAELATREAHFHHLRELFLRHLCQHANPVVLNGPATGGLPHTLNLSFPGIRSETLLMALDLAGVACSAGSACSSGSLLPSPTLQAMHVPEGLLRSALRFSFSAQTTVEESVESAYRISRIVQRLRSLAGESS